MSSETLPVMLLIHLLLQSILWLSIQAMIRKVNVIAERAVFVTDDLPKQSNDDLERIASMMRNSFCEIMKPEFDYEDKVRLRWLGDQQICGAVRRRYLHRVPVVYVHYIEDKDESEFDSNLTAEYLDNLAQKLRKDITQIVTRLSRLTSIYQRIDSLHVVTNLSYAEYHQRCQWINNLWSRGRDSEIVKGVLDRQLMPIPHRIHASSERIESFEELTVNIARGVSAKQSYDPLHHPAIHIHLFPNERSFVRYGGELWDELTADPKQVVTIAAPDARQQRKCRLFWYGEKHEERVWPTGSVGRYLLVELLETLSDRQVLEDSNRLARAVHIAVRRISENALEGILDSMWNITQSTSLYYEEALTPEVEPALLREMARKIITLKQRVDNKSDPLYAPWKEAQGQTMNLEEKSKRIDIFMKVWDEIMMKELVLYESNPNKRESFWMSFGIVARRRIRRCWPEDVATRHVVDAMVSNTLSAWKAIDHYLDPSYALNILLFGGLDVTRSMIRAKCLEFGFSWKALRASIQWIDCDDADTA